MKCTKQEAIEGRGFWLHYNIPMKEDGLEAAFEAFIEDDSDDNYATLKDRVVRHLASSKNRHIAHFLFKSIQDECKELVREWDSDSTKKY